MRCAGSIEKLTAGGAFTIVALGDSLTQGWMARKGYVDFVGEALRERYPGAQLTVVNRGVPGGTAEEGLERLRRDVLDLDPDLVFVQFGLNDLSLGVPVERFKRTVYAIVNQIRDNTAADILLITSVPIMGSPAEDRMAEEFYAALASLAESERTGLAMVHAYWKKRIAEGAEFDKLVQFDGVHPTVEGYRLMAEAVLGML